MKKLALALVCLVSVAFFASCDPKVENPEPSISILASEGYLYDGAVINLDEEYAFGFMVASNPETQKELASIAVTVDDEPYETVQINGTSYTYQSVISFVSDREIIGEAVIKAVVTDVAGETNSAQFTVSINEEEKLTEYAFEWYRLGNTQTGLEDFGLYWEQNAKATHAQIKPMDGVQMFIFDASVWDETITVADEANLFNKALETMHTEPVYNNVSTSASGTYNDVIGTIQPNGITWLINVKKCEIGEFQSAGYPITISGVCK